MTQREAGIGVITFALLLGAASAAAVVLVFGQLVAVSIGLGEGLGGGPSPREFLLMLAGLLVGGLLVASFVSTAVLTAASAGVPFVRVTGSILFGGIVQFAAVPLLGGPLGSLAAFGASVVLVYRGRRRQPRGNRMTGAGYIK